MTRQTFTSDKYL